MKTFFVTRGIAAAVLCFNGVIWADIGVDTLPASNPVADVWHLECFDDGSGEPDRVVARIQKTAGAGTLRLGLSGVFDFFSSAGFSVTDSTLFGLPSAYISESILGNDNRVALIVLHSAAAANTYELRGACEQATGPIGSGLETGNMLTMEFDQ